jgi:hypothetical protein
MDYLHPCGMIIKIITYDKRLIEYKLTDKI